MEKDSDIIILGGKLKNRVLGESLVTGRNAHDARVHIKQDSHFIKLACVPAEPVPWESGKSLCVDEVIKQVSNCMSLSQWGKGRNGEGTLGQGTCRPQASSIGPREKGDLRWKPRKGYKSPCH